MVNLRREAARLTITCLSNTLGSGFKKFLRLRHHIVVLMLCLTIGLSNSSAALAQQISGTISGQVSDERSAVISGAAVTIESVELAIKRLTKTNNEGYFVVPNLPVGIYKVSVEAQGFNPFIQESIKLDVGSTFN